ncbi:MAG: DNA internalization-related competence protein ComEC/Rec2 [Gammaproteobacteria bacterium]|nr:DNA internalization-related competence protein ComEC/Rec2 [Gammaproteobacteria bacterium]
MFKLDAPGVANSQARMLRVHWYRPTAQIEAGDYLRLKLLLTPIKASFNKGLSNYEDQLFYRGIQGTAIVKDFHFVENQCSWHQIDCFRSDLKSWISETVTNASTRPLLVALAIGDSSQLTYRHRRILAATGTQHLFVVSGLHIGLFAWACTWLFHHMGFSYHYRLLGAFGCSFAFAALAGLSLSVQRALLMLACYLVLALFRRSAASYAGFSIALALVLVFNPLATGDRGFWFSFSAVAILLLSQFGEVGWASKQKWLGLIVRFRTQGCIFIGLAPLILGLSGQLPLLSVIVNLAAIPWLTLLVVPLLLMVVSARLIIGGLENEFITGGLDRLLQLSEQLAGMLWWFLEFSAEMSPAYAFGNIELLASGAALLAIVIFILPLRLSSNWLLLLSVLPLANFNPSRPPPGELSLSVFDVGQGLSIHLQTQSQDILYDTGSRSLSGSDKGQSVILPALRLLGVNKLDKMILSHSDNDHIGGAQSILKGISVRAVIGAGFGGCTPARLFEADNVKFRVFQVMKTNSDNNNSCLLLITGKHFTLLITGDIEADAEYELVTQQRRSLDLITVPHHGSRSSSSPALLNHLMPAQAVIASGYKNPFGHPDARVVERYKARSIVVLNTATSGALSFTAGVGGVVLVSQELPLQRRFWRYQR